MSDDCKLSVDSKGFVVTGDGVKVCRTDGTDLYFQIKDRRKQHERGSCEVRVTLNQLTNLVDKKES